MTYNVFGEMLNLTQSINYSGKNCNCAYAVHIGDGQTRYVARHWTVYLHNTMTAPTKVKKQPLGSVAWLAARLCKRLIR